MVQDGVDREFRNNIAKLKADISKYKDLLGEYGIIGVISAVDDVFELRPYVNPFGDDEDDD